jgi:hypothetical protein
MNSQVRYVGMCTEFFEGRSVKPGQKKPTGHKLCLNDSGTEIIIDYLATDWRYDSSGGAINSFDKNIQQLYDHARQGFTDTHCPRPEMFDGRDAAFAANGPAYVFSELSVGNKKFTQVHTSLVGARKSSEGWVFTFHGKVDAPRAKRTRDLEAAIAPMRKHSRTERVERGAAADPVPVKREKVTCSSKVSVVKNSGATAAQAVDLTDEGLAPALCWAYIVTLTLISHNPDHPAIEGKPRMTVKYVGICRKQDRFQLTLQDYNNTDQSGKHSSCKLVPGGYNVTSVSVKNFQYSGDLWKTMGFIEEKMVREILREMNLPSDPNHNLYVRGSAWAKTQFGRPHEVVSDELVVRANEDVFYTGPNAGLPFGMSA